MLIPALIPLGCWLVFLIYWLISALAVKATAERNSFASSLPYRIPLVIGAAILARPRWPYPMNFHLTPRTYWTLWIGATACLAGLCVAIWSRWTLAGNWSSDVRFRRGHELVKTGPYRFVRHPIYTGILLMVAAPAIQFGRVHHWLGALIIGIGLWIKLKQEESVMERHFPEYSEYRNKVKALVPFLI